jgi:hypothetical protein
MKWVQTDLLGRNAVMCLGKENYQQHHIHNYSDSFHSKADHPAIDTTKCHWFHWLGG